MQPPNQPVPMIQFQTMVRSLAWFWLKQAIRRQFPHVSHISPSALADWLQQDQLPQPILLDARSPAEYAVSHLLQAQLVSSPEQLRPVLQQERSTPIVVYCSVGYRSAVLAQQLQAEGFTNVQNLEGSLFEWVNEHRPVYRGQQPVQQVHPYSALWRNLLNSPNRITIPDNNSGGRSL